MQNESITQQESLAIIESMINKAKNQFSENGFVYLLWGWVIFICSTSQFILQRLNFSKHYLVWTLTWVALAVQIIYYSRKEKRRVVKTYTDEIAGYIWLAFVIMLVLFAVLISSRLSDAQTYLGTVVILILYGMPTFLSGIILKFKPLIAGGACCWVLSILAVLIPHHLNILLISVAVIAAWIIPGYLLRSKYKKENL